MERLTGTTQLYHWGSRTLLANLRGLDSSTQPEAEVWYGAHPDAPSTLSDGSTLLDRIDIDPSAELGEDVADRFEGRLPFLLKLLAADKPLSIQAHPSAVQASAGFAREEVDGIDLHAPNRSFRDRCHRSELIVAITPFEALIGFRDPGETSSLLRALRAESLAQRVISYGPAAAVRWLLAPPADDSDEVAKTVTTIGEAAADYVDGTIGPSDRDWLDEARLLVTVATHYPDDAGIAVAALLNRIHLQPGEGLFVDAGTLHTYIGGLGVEITANSNNVLRGGLTPKYVNVDALLDVLSPNITSADRAPVDDGTFRTSTDEFVLTCVTTEMPVTGPAIVLSVTGTALVADRSSTLSISPTEAVWLAAGETATVTTTGTTFVAQVGS